MTNAITSVFSGSPKIQALFQRLPEILSLVLTIVCAYTLATISWGLITENDKPTFIPEQINNNNPGNQTNALQSFRELSNAHLFGITTKKVEITQTKAPETKLNFVLKGVLAAVPMSLASAIIARSSNSAEEIYGIGDKLPGNVTIKEIHSDHVILERAGRLETLRLPKDAGAAQVSSNFSTARFSSSSDSSIKTIRDDIRRNPTSFGDYALPVVVKEKGKQIGYRLQFQEKGDVLKSAGLRATDIITSINGIKLDQPRNAMNALRKLSTANQLNIIVKRNGMEVPINLQL